MLQDGDYELVTRLNSIVTQGNRTKPDEFEFNKDAGMYQCKAGHIGMEMQGAMTIFVVNLKRIINMMSKK